MKILSHRSELQKQLRISEMLLHHAEKHHQREAIHRYRKRSESIRKSLASKLGWINREARLA